MATFEFIWTLRNICGLAVQSSLIQPIKELNSSRKELASEEFQSYSPQAAQIALSFIELADAAANQLVEEYKEIGTSRAESETLQHLQRYISTALNYYWVSASTTLTLSPLLTLDREYFMHVANISP
jgi:hypothetical protein